MRAELSATGAAAGAAPVEYAVAVERFLAQACLSPASRRVYRISLAGWAWALVGQPPPAGSQRRGARPPVVPLALLDRGDAAAKLAAAVALRAGHADIRTVNREISALRSAAGWWLDMGWIGHDPTAVFFAQHYFNHHDHREVGWALLDALLRDPFRQRSYQWRIPTRLTVSNR